MCGFSGVYSIKKNVNNLKFKPLSLAHRGPDHYDKKNYNYVNLNFYRLKILGQENGKQPILSENKKWLMVFNGEIYNYIELAKFIKRPDLIDKGDTKVLIEFFAKKKFKYIQKLNGMFSLVLINLNTKKIFFIRDRFGIKPAYYLIKNKVIYFASEIKAIPASNVSKKEINEYLQNQQYPSSNKTFFKNIYEIPPGTINEFKNNKLKTKRFYSLTKQLKLAKNKRPTISDFEKKLENSIKFRLRADRPINLHFSGGIDSTALICKLVDILGKNINKIGIMYLDFGVDKFSLYRAKYVCKKLNLKLKIIKIEKKKILRLIQEAQYFMDEPFGGLSSIGAAFLNKNQKKVPISLEGQGADEILVGYKSHIVLFLRDLLKSNRKLFDLIKLTYNLTKNDVIKLSNYILNSNFGGALDLSQITKRRRKNIIKKNFLRSIEEFNIKNNKIPRVLRFHDRLSAGYSRELRFPYLDHNVVETALLLRDRDKFYKGYSKGPLLRIIEKKISLKIFLKEKTEDGGKFQKKFLLENKKFIIKNLTNLNKKKIILPKIINEKIKYIKSSNFLKSKNTFDIWQLINLNYFFDHQDFLKKHYKI